MFVRFYVRRGVAIIPTLGVTARNLYIDIEPIEVVSLADRDAFLAAVERAAARGNPLTPDPSLSSPDGRPVLRHAKVRSWRELERSASPWAIEEQDKQLEVVAYRPSPEGGWDEDARESEVLPPSASVPEAALNILSRLG